LNKIFALAKEESCDVRVYDTSRTADRVKALKRGIFRTPAVIIEDVKYQGLEAIAQAATIKLKR
jgi:2-hydroxychromene-2-carboxylate isomerase